MLEENTLKSANLTIRFCGKGVQPPMATATLLPVLVNSCPENFSTVDYFDVSIFLFCPLHIEICASI